MTRMLLRLTTLIVLSSMLAACAGASSPSAPTSTAAAPAQAATTPTAAIPVTSTTQTAPAEGAVSPTQAVGMRTFQIVPEQTQASYEVQEKFMNRDLPNQAIGTTNSVEGTVLLSTEGKPTASIPKMTVDISTLASDQNRRDQRIRSQWLESSKYPTATFVSTGIEGGPDTYTEGQEVSFKLNGDLTIREVTKPVTFDVKAKLNGDTLSGSAVTQILMKDFGFDPPVVAGMLSVKDGVTVTVNFTAKEQK